MIPAADRGATSELPPLPEQEAEMRGLRKVNHFENCFSVLPSEPIVALEKAVGLIPLLHPLPILEQLERGIVVQV